MNPQADKVIRYYNSTAFDYKLLWMGPKDLAMHFGYFDETVKTHEESLLKMNEVLAGYAGIASDERVLDAGCGYGGTAIWLAEKAGCNVVGVTLVPNQVKQAAASARHRGVADKVQFYLGDYTALSFPDASFDVIWGLESIVHCENKKDFAREAFRLLKGGGRIMIAEFLLRGTPSLTEIEKKKVNQWIEGWAMPNLLTPQGYEKLLADEGFKDIEVHDITPFVEPSMRKLGRLSSFSYPIARFLHRTKIFDKERFGNVRASDLQFKAFREGLWRYMVVTASKPTFG